jgi:hypothetical protein
MGCNPSVLADSALFASVRRQNIEIWTTTLFGNPRYWTKLDDAQLGARLIVDFPAIAGLKQARIRLIGCGYSGRRRLSAPNTLKARPQRAIPKKGCYHELSNCRATSLQRDLRPHGPCSPDPHHSQLGCASRWLPYWPKVERCRRHRLRRALRMAVDARIQGRQVEG